MSRRHASYSKSAGGTFSDFFFGLVPLIYGEAKSADNGLPMVASSGLVAGREWLYRPCELDTFSFPGKPVAFEATGFNCEGVFPVVIFHH
jgi:hypothetical protein